MKKLSTIFFLFTTLLGFCLIFKTAFAAPATDSAKKGENLNPNKEGTSSSKNKTSPAVTDKQKELIEKVASRESELREKRKRAFFGEIKSIKDERITLLTESGEKTVIIDDTTKFVWIKIDGSKLPITQKDIEPGDKIAAVGVLNEDNTLQARRIIGRLYPTNINGVITDIKKGSLTVAGQNGDVSLTVSTTATTKVSIWQKGEGLVKGTVSDLAKGQRVHINGLAKQKDKTIIEANRILVLPGLATGIKESTPSAKSTP